MHFQDFVSMHKIKLKQAFMHIHERSFWKLTRSTLPAKTSTETAMTKKNMRASADAEQTDFLNDFQEGVLGECLWKAGLSQNIFINFSSCPFMFPSLLSHMHLLISVHTYMYTEAGINSSLNILG